MPWHPQDLGLGHLACPEAHSHLGSHLPFPPAEPLSLHLLGTQVPSTPISLSVPPPLPAGSRFTRPGASFSTLAAQTCSLPHLSFPVLHRDSSPHSSHSFTLPTPPPTSNSVTLPASRSHILTLLAFFPLVEPSQLCLEITVMEPGQEKETVAPQEPNLSPKPNARPIMINKNLQKGGKKKKDLEELKKEAAMVRKAKANHP